MTAPRVFESLSAASAALGLPVPILRAAKAIAAPHFKIGNRIREVEDGVPLKKWISDHSEELKAQGENISLKDQKTNQEIRRLKLANDTKEGTLVPRASVFRAISQFGNAIIPILNQKLENEYPAAVAGMDVASARILGKRLNDSIKQEIQKFSTFWEI